MGKDLIMFHVQEVTFGEKLFDAFIDLPYQLYQNDPLWIPPLKHSQIALFHPDLNPFFQHAKVKYFVGLNQQQEVVGRIAAFIDNNRLDFLEKKIGCFGFYECINDQLLAKLLYQSAETFLKDEGIKIIQGPMQFNIYTGYRFQVGGFDYAPFMGDVRNFPYYQTQCEQNGYHQEKKWESAHLTKEIILDKMKLIKPAYELCLKLGFTFKSIKPEEMESFLPQFAPLALEIFAENYGYSKITVEEFLHFFKPSLLLVTPGSFAAAYDKNGELAGFIYNYFDVADIFRKMQGDASKLSLMANRQFSHIILHTYGVSKKYRAKLPVVYAVTYFSLKAMNMEEFQGTGLVALARCEIKKMYDDYKKGDTFYAIYQKEI